MAMEDNVFRFEIHGEAAGQAIDNHIDYVSTDPSVPLETTDLEELLAEAADKWATVVMPQAWNFYSAESFYLKEIVDAQIVSVGPPPRYEFLYNHQYLEIPDPVPFGSLAGDILPTYAAASIWKTTNVSGRNYRGSLRFGPILEDNTVENALKDLFRTSLDLAFAAMETLVTAGGVSFNAVVTSGLLLAQDVAPIPVPKTYTRDIILFRTRRFLGTQLSRKRRLG